MSIDGPAPDAFDMVVENAAACALSLFIRLKVLRWLSKSSPRLCWLRSWPWRRLSPRTGCLRTDTDEFFKNTAWNNKIRGECLTTRQFFSHTVQGELSSSWKSIHEALHSTQDSIVPIFLQVPVGKYGDEKYCCHKVDVCGLWDIFLALEGVQYIPTFCFQAERFNPCAEMFSTCTQGLKVEAKGAESQDGITCGTHVHVQMFREQWGSK